MKRTYRRNIFDALRPAHVTPVDAALASALAIAAAILSVAISPAAADAIRAQFVSVSCSSTTACVVGTNASSGPGVSGTSSVGTGVSGTSTGSAYGLLATSRSGVGIKSTAGSNDAIVATNASTSSPTVEALQAGSGTALEGTSKAAGSGVTATSGSGTAALATSKSGIGLSAVSATASAIFANSARYTSLIAQSSSASAISAYAGGPSMGRTAAVYADSTAGTPLRVENSTGYGIVVESQSGTGVHAQSQNGNGIDATGTYIGVIGRSPASGYPLVATGGGNDVFWVDGAGNLTYTGSIGTYARSARGSELAFGANATTPTVEDVGSSRLRRGLVRVTLDPAFARSIEGMGRYRIFLMPDGDTNGLFVAERDPAGFVVRETRGGRGSIAFDYRIVATTIGHGNERAAFVTERGAPRTPLQTMKSHAGREGRAR